MDYNFYTWQIAYQYLNPHGAYADTLNVYALSMEDAYNHIANNYGNELNRDQAFKTSLNAMAPSGQFNIIGSNFIGLYTPKLYDLGISPLPNNQDGFRIFEQQINDLSLSNQDVVDYCNFNRLTVIKTVSQQYSDFLRARYRIQMNGGYPERAVDLMLKQEAWHILPRESFVWIV